MPWAPVLGMRMCYKTATIGHVGQSAMTSGRQLLKVTYTIASSLFLLHKTFLRARRWLQLYTLMGSELDKMTSLGTGNGRKQATD